jgi:hypothetical protein
LVDEYCRDHGGEMRSTKDIEHWPRGPYYFGGYAYSSRKEAIEAVRRHNKVMQEIMK